MCSIYLVACRPPAPTRIHAVRTGMFVGANVLGKFSTHSLPLLQLLSLSLSSHCIQCTFNFQSSRFVVWRWNYVLTHTKWMYKHIYIFDFHLFTCYTNSFSLSLMLTHALFKFNFFLFSSIALQGRNYCQQNYCVA